MVPLPNTHIALFFHPIYHSHQTYMSTAAAASKAAAATHRAVPHVVPKPRGATRARTSPPSSAKGNSFLFHIYEPNPRPLNCTSHLQTGLIASDPSHPLFIKTNRRLASFNPGILHWNVKVPVSLSKKAVVRNWATRRVREAFKQVLKERGWDREGRVLVEGQRPLKGALCLKVRPDPKPVLHASGEEVREQCGRVLTAVLERMDRPKWATRGGMNKEERRGSDSMDDLLDKREEV